MINKDFFLALEDLEREKGIPQDDFIKALEDGLVFAYKKHTGTASGISVRINPEKKTIRIFSTKEVAAEVTDEEKQISLEEAREIKKNYKEGDVIETEIVPKDFGQNRRADRKAGRNAKAPRNRKNQHDERVRR